MRIIVLSMVFLVFLSGCSIDNEIIERTKSLPEAQAFLKKNPDSNITVFAVKETDANLFIDEIQKKCGKEIAEASFWHSIISKESQKLEVFFDAKTKQVICVFEEGAERDECRINAECNDSNEATADACEGKPMKCVHTLRTCLEINGKSCGENYKCPKQAVRTSDSEQCCLEECVQKTCSEIGGGQCGQEQECTGRIVAAKDNEECCLGLCRTIDLCAGITCGQNQKCEKGECIPKTCFELGESVCDQNMSCSGSITVSKDSNQCCVGICQPIDLCAGITCSADKKCQGGECILKSCAERNGVICQQNQKCKDNTVVSQDTNSCCMSVCENVLGDLSTSGSLTVKSLENFVEIKEPLCSPIGLQYLFFDLVSTVPSSIAGVEYDLYLDGQKQSQGKSKLGRFTGRPEFSTEITPGTNTVYVDYNKTIGGHSLKIAVDSNNIIVESDENNNFAEKTFPNERMDLNAGSVQANYFVPGFNITIPAVITLKRDKKTIDCPAFTTDVYIDGAKSVLLPPTFSGFTKGNNLEGDVFVWGNELSTGSHTIRVVIDTGNSIEETNEANNDATIAVNVQ